MLSKQRIEQQLDHFRNACAGAGSVENEIWVKALEWVLGDEEHREAYAAFIRSLVEIAQERPDPQTVSERITLVALRQALDRLV
jgi:hypothetical protein